MAETLSLLSIISFAIAGVCLVLAVFLWFFFKIPSVIGDLSGKTARKSIAKMRVANEKNGIKSYKESKINADRGKLTDTIPESSGRLRKKKIILDDDKPETGLLNENNANFLESNTSGVFDKATDVLCSETTAVLIIENATAPLNDTEHKPIGGICYAKKVHKDKRTGAGSVPAEI